MEAKNFHIFVKGSFEVSLLGIAFPFIPKLNLFSYQMMMDDATGNQRFDIAMPFLGLHANRCWCKTMMIKKTVSESKCSLKMDFKL
jgi:hypothetical protein